MKDHTIRIKIFSGIIFLVALILLTKLFFLQVLRNEAFASRADRQYVTPIENIYNRGSILFMTKDKELVSAASISSGFKITINPRAIKNPEEAFNVLNQIISLNKEEFLAKAIKDDPYEEIAFRQSKEVADKISELKIPGVSVFKERWRFYPGNELASRAIGLVAFDADKQTGRYGLERSYNHILERQADKLYINFFAEVFANLSQLVFEKEKPGNVVTSIEPSVQGVLEEQLAGIIKKWNSNFAGGIILNPKNGEVYAMAHLPQINLNDFSKVRDVSLFGNPIVESVFEFGSVIKALTMAAALNEGKVTADTKYDDKGFIVVGKETINNFDKKGRGVTNMQEVLNQSLNTGAVFAMQKLGRDKFRKYFFDFGLKERTGVDLPSEVKNLVSNLEGNQDVEYATASFGQGIATSPISAARAFSALANGGTLVTPHLVTKIDFDDLPDKEIKKTASPNQIIKPETAEEITRMLTVVFDKSINKTDSLLKRYNIAAKTGTAQIAKEQGGGYYEDKHLHSFFAYFPAYNPEFLVLLYTKDPKGARFASETMAGPFMNIAKFLISYYEIPPDR